MEKTKASISGPVRPSTSNPTLRANAPLANVPARGSQSNSTTTQRSSRPGTSISNSWNGSGGLTSIGATEENVRVVVRVRPLNKKEQEKGCREVVLIHQPDCIIEIKNPAVEGEKEGKSFTFDGVFPGDTPQAELYNQVARPIVENVIEGYNGTIFAYGQTGTGKTYTMEGDNSAPELLGIIPNSFAQIFSHVSNATNEQSFLVRVSYLEIYNDEVRDLLGKNVMKKLEVKEKFDTGVYVKDLQSFVVETEDHMDKIMQIGNKNRTTGATNMNISSSRSHAIFTITVECSTVKEDGKRTLRMGKLNLVDLAGSERVSKTGATGERLKEGSKINLSLSCLGNVISALVEGQAHIPYRSSKLTRLLQDSLGGNSRTIMITNIGPADYNYEETLSSLRYADRAKHIRNRARINEDPKDALLRQFENEIEELKRQLMEAENNPTTFLPASEHSLAQEAGELEGGPAADSDGEDYPRGKIVIPDEETLHGIKGAIESQEQITSSVRADTEEKNVTLSALKDNVLSWKQYQYSSYLMSHSSKRQK